MSSVQQKQGGGSGNHAPSSTTTTAAPSSASANTPSSLPLNNEAVFRIELSFSSRKSSVIVMRCTARLYSLERVGQGAGQGEGPQAANQGEALFLFIYFLGALLKSFG